MTGYYIKESITVALCRIGAMFFGGQVTEVIRIKISAAAYVAAIIKYLSLASAALSR